MACVFKIGDHSGRMADLDFWSSPEPEVDENSCEGVDWGECVTNKRFQFQNHLTNWTILKYINAPV